MKARPRSTDLWNALFWSRELPAGNAGSLEHGWIASNLACLSRPPYSLFANGFAVFRITGYSGRLPAAEMNNRKESLRQ